MNSSKSETIYVYHSHLKLSPPSNKDLSTHVWLEEEAELRGKKLVSRIVGPYGLWEYDVEHDSSDKTDILASGRIDEVSRLIDDEVYSQQLVDKIIDMYRENGVNVTFKER